MRPSFPRRFLLVLIVCFLPWMMTQESVNKACSTIPSVGIPAHTNWPFRVDCSHLEKAWRSNPNSRTGDIFQCNVSHSGETNFSCIFELSTMNENKKFQVLLVVNGNDCLASEVDIELEPLPQKTCQDNVKEAFENKEIIYTQATQRDQKELRCMPLKGGPAFIPEGVSDEFRAEFQTTWYVDCEGNPKSQQMEFVTFSRKQKTDTNGYGNKLVVPSINAYDAANWTCSVTYRGRTVYGVTYTQCVYQYIEKQPRQTVCTKFESAPLGGSAHFGCKGVIGYGMTPSEDFVVEWRKGDEVLCETSFFNQSTSGKDSRISCEVRGINESAICVNNRWQSDKEMYPGKKELSINLNVRSLQSSDFGDWEIVVKYRDQGVWFEDTSSITLREDLVPYYKRLRIGLIIALVVLTIVSTIVILIWNFRIYILVAYKRSRLTKYDKDDKEWVAYLSYHYDGSAETEKEEKSKEMVKNIIKRISNAMKSLNYSYYDEQKQGDFSDTVEHITNIVKKCHRMILVLTPGYLDDRWKRFHAELAFQGLLESRIGLVVVLTPGIKTLLKKKAENDAVWQKLLISLKSNRVIRWKKKMSENEFIKHIEYGMPKLQRNRPQNVFDQERFL